MKKNNSVLTLAKLLQWLSEIACLVAKEKNFKRLSRHIAALGILPHVDNERVNLKSFNSVWYLITM